MKFTKNPYLTIKEQFELLERWVLVHSVIYYKLNSSVVDDFTYDANCNQLFDYICKYSRDFKLSKYYYAFKDFDGSTGYHLVSSLSREDFDKVLRDARHIIKLVEKLGGVKCQKRI